MWTDCNARLKAVQKAKKLTHVEIAAILQERGFSTKRAAVGHWLNGIRPPTLPQFFALCDLLR